MTNLENKYTGEELINFVSSSPYFSDHEKDSLTKVLKSESSDNKNLKVLLAAEKDGLIQLPHLPRAENWVMDNKNRVADIIEERYEQGVRILHPNIYSDKLFGKEENLKKIIDEFFEMYKGTDNENILPIMYKITCIPRKNFIPLLNLLLLKLCTVEELGKIVPLSDEGVAKFIKTKLIENYLYSDQLLDYAKMKRAREIKWNVRSERGDITFFEMAYIMWQKFTLKNYERVQGLSVTYVDDVLPRLDFKNCYKDEEHFASKYWDVYNGITEDDITIKKKLQIFLDDEPNNTLLKRLAARYINDGTELFKETNYTQLFYDYRHVVRIDNICDFFTSVDNAIFNPIFKDLTPETSYKLVISDSQRLSKIKSYGEYLQELINFFFPYYNSLKTVNEMAYVLMDNNSYDFTNDIKQQIENSLLAILNEPYDLITHVDTKLNKVLFTKRFLLALSYPQGTLDAFDYGVELLMTKIKLMKLYMMAIYSMSSVNLKTKKG